MDKKKSLIKAFWLICTLKHGPQILPNSLFLLALTSTLSLLISSTINTFSAALTELVFVSGITGALLFSLGHQMRLMQTLTAIMGSSVIVGTVVLFVLIIQPSPSLLIRLLIFFWNLSILANILKNSIEIHYFQAGVLSIVYAFALNQIVITVENYLAQPNVN